MNISNSDITVYMNESGFSRIVINKSFAPDLSPDEAADLIRELWADYVLPIQPGLIEIYAPMRRALEASAAQEQIQLKPEE